MNNHKNKNCLTLSKINKLTLDLTLAMSLYSPISAFADASSQRNTAPLKPDVPYLFVVHNGRSIRIDRDIDNSYSPGINIRGTLVQTARSCPPFCLKPMQLELPVETVGEAEIIDFMLTKLRSSTGALVDIRSKNPYEAGTIPGSVNHFVQKIQKRTDDAEFEKMLESFGAERRNDVGSFDKILESTGLKDTSMLTDDWDFTEAKELILFSNSAMEGASEVAIKELLAAGYPAKKLKWYRGGLAAWQYWGFTTFVKRR